LRRRSLRRLQGCRWQAGEKVVTRHDLKITAGRASPKQNAGEPASCTKKAPPLPCVTVPLNFLETEGTRWTDFDFQLRPVGHSRN
jgi:hypothetical protein